MPMISAIFAAILAVSGSACVGKAGHGCRGGSPAAGLAVLPDVASTDLHLVADDWSGSGNWASRVGGYTATVTGSPAKSLAVQFPGRYEIGSLTTSAAFYLAANAAHTVQTNDTITYEWIVKTPTAVTTTKAVGGYVSVGATQIFNIGYVNSLAGNLESAVYNSAGSIYLGNTAAAAWQMTSRYNFYTVVMDIAAPRYEVYINGASVFEDTTTSGTLSPTNTNFGIGARYHGPSGTFQNALDEGGTILEVVRHREAFSDSTVAARAAQFNTLKGY